jgi:hypothetical protein
VWAKDQDVWGAGRGGQAAKFGLETRVIEDGGGQVKWRAAQLPCPLALM